MYLKSLGSSPALLISYRSPTVLAPVMEPPEPISIGQVKRMKRDDIRAESVGSYLRRNDKTTYDGNILAHSRSKSAEQRKTSCLFHNRWNWECQQYRVKASMAYTGRTLFDVEGVNDLALVSSVASRVAEALVLAPSRVGLVFDGQRLRWSHTKRISLYHLGAFRRCLEFEVVILPPRRCKICRYDLRITGVMPAGRFVPGEEVPDYLFLEERNGPFQDTGQTDQTDQEDSDSSSIGDIERDDAWRADEFCYCASIAAEFGWRSMRTWGRIARGLRRQMRSRIAECSVSPTQDGVLQRNWTDLDMLVGDLAERLRHDASLYRNRGSTHTLEGGRERK